MTNALIVRNKIVFLLIGEKKRGKKSSSLTGDQKKSSGSLKTWPKSIKTSSRQTMMHPSIVYRRGQERERGR